MLRDRFCRGIFLPGLSSRTTENDLRTKFATYGNIRDVRIVKKGPENNPVGKGMIWFDSGDVAQKLVRQTFMVDGAEVKVAPLLVSASVQRFGELLVVRGLVLPLWLDHS